MDKRPKYGGRVKGSPNIITSEIRQQFQNIIEDNLQQINKDLKAIEDPATRIRLLLDLAKFVIPSLKQTEFTSVQNEGVRPIQIISLGRGINPEHETN
jgi:hypothetical protein